MKFGKSARPASFAQWGLLWKRCCGCALLWIFAGAAVMADDATSATAEADKLLQAGNWTEAEKKYTAITGEADVLDRAKKLAAAAKFFRETAAATKIAPEALAADLFMLTLKDGTQFRGKYDRDRSDNDDVAFIKDGGAVIFLNRKQIVKRTPIKQEERDKQMQAELEELRKAANDDVALFLCGVKALEYNQLPAAHACFYEAAMKDANVRQNVREYRAARLFAQAFLDRNLRKKAAAEKKFKELRSQYADCAATGLIEQTIADADALAAALVKKKEEMAALAKMKKEEAAEARAKRRRERSANKELAAIEEEIESAMDELGDANPDTAKADKLAAAANQLIKTAQTADSRDTANKSYKEALGSLRSAAALYQKSLDKKYDAAIERKLDEVSKKMYWCRKLQTV